MQHLDEGTIHAWLDGELPPAEAATAEAHVAACDECQAAVAEARGFIAGSSRILLALDAVPGGVLPASTSAATAKARAPKRFTISRAWMAAAALLVLSTATLIVVRPRPNVAITTVAARDEAAQSPTAAAAPMPTPAPSKQAAANAPVAIAQGKAAPRDQNDMPRKRAERQPMTVAEAPAASRYESAKRASEAGDPGAGADLKARAADAAVAVTGRVVSEAGAPLGSASVQLAGTRIVTLTNDDGSYALRVPVSRADGKAESLVARLIGYKAAEAQIVPGSDSITKDFVLRANAVALQELVVTGEGTTSSAEKLGSAIASADSAPNGVSAAAPIRIRGSKTTTGGRRAGLSLTSGTFAELTSRTSSGESGEPVDISLYRVNGVYITFIDRLRPDTTRVTFEDPAVTRIEGEHDKRGVPINRLDWKDSEGRMRTLRGPVSLELLQQLKRALDNPTP